MPVAAEYFIGTVNGELVCHLAACPMFTANAYRCTRLVVMPEWQGAGCGTKFLEWVCEYHKQGRGRCERPLPVLFHTSHPQLVGYLKSSKKWVLKSQMMGGGNRGKSMKSINKSQAAGSSHSALAQKFTQAGFGGHFRAVQGFKYIGLNGN